MFLEKAHWWLKTQTWNQALEMSSEKMITLCSDKVL